MISFNSIKQSAEQIGRTLNPKKIILFGSYAYGKPTPDSDVDLLVVVKKGEKLSQQYDKISKILEPRYFPVDILIRTSHQLQQRLKIGDSFIQDILENGKVLYES